MNSHPEQTARLAHAAQRADVPPFRVMDVLSAAARRQETHGDVVSLAAGQPSNPAPEPVRAAAKRAIDEQNLGYTEQLGIPPLRQGIAEHYRRNYGLSVAAEDVVVTTGSSGAFLLAFLAAFDAGDRVALPRPGYPAYRNILSALGCEVVDLPCGEDGVTCPPRTWWTRQVTWQEWSWRAPPTRRERCCARISWPRSPRIVNGGAYGWSPTRSTTVFRSRPNRTVRGARRAPRSW